MRIYDLTVKDIQGNDVALSDYRGKVLLIVNTATGCGFTPQYEGLQALYEKYSAEGFEILDFPCNQFADQAPGTNDEIVTFCKGRFGVTFPQFSKIEVRGENADPLYKWIEANTTFDGFEGAAGLMLSAVAKKMDKDYKKNSAIKWNFTKILVGRDGNIIARFEPMVNLKKVKEKIQENI